MMAKFLPWMARTWIKTLKIVTRFLGWKRYSAHVMLVHPRPVTVKRTMRP